MTDTSNGHCELEHVHHAHHTPTLRHHWEVQVVLALHDLTTQDKFSIIAVIVVIVVIVVIRGARTQRASRMVVEGVMESGYFVITRRTLVVSGARSAATTRSTTS